LLCTILTASLGGPAFDPPAAASPATPATPAELQDLILTTPWCLQGAGEFEAIVATESAARARDWSSSLETEYGFGGGFQLALTRSMAAAGEPAGWDAEALWSPWSSLSSEKAAATQPWRLALGASHSWADGEASDAILLAGIERERLQLYLDTRLERSVGTTHGAWALAAVRPWRRWLGLLEVAHDGADASTLRLSPGATWMLTGGIALTAGAPCGVGGGRASAGIELDLSAEVAH
jgi:hypothetical protein